MKRVGKYPAIVRAYDQAARQCRVEIPGITDGAELLPLAELCYGIGDKSEHTEVRILEGDRVWVEFEAGDERYPIIVGFRPMNTGNDPGHDWRRWHHQNIQTDADTDQLHTAGRDYTVQAGQDIAAQADHDISASAGNDVSVDAGANIDATAAESISADAGKDIKATAGKTITLQVGAATITVTADTITISAGGSEIKLSPSGFTASAPAIGFTQA